VQVGHERPADLGVGRQLAEVYAPHPTRGDVSDQKRPPGEASDREELDQLIGAAGRRVCGRGCRILLPLIRAGVVSERHPPGALTDGEIQVVLGAGVEPGRAERLPGLVDLDKIPPQVAAAPLLRALEAALQAVGSL